MTTDAEGTDSYSSSAFNSETGDFDAFVEYLFATGIQPNLPLLRRRHRHPFEDEVEWAFDNLRRAHRLVTFISQSPDDPYYTFTNKSLSNGINSAASGLSFHNRLAKDAGVLDVLDDHYNTLLGGIEERHLPVEERELMRKLGFPEVSRYLPAIVYLAKSQRREGKRQVSQELEGLANRLSETAEDHRKAEPSNEPGPRKKEKKWFKGLGQIVQGTAMSLADIALVAGMLHLPVSPETQTWGALASATTGVGLVLGGIGDLRGE